MSYTELSVWTRGIIMDKEGRDIVNSISASARKEGKFAQAMENYVDNPDRTNCPTRKYCRVSDTVLENELTYENDHPNIVVGQFVFEHGVAHAAILARRAIGPIGIVHIVLHRLRVLALFPGRRGDGVDDVAAFLVHDDAARPNRKFRIAHVLTLVSISLK